MGSRRGYGGIPTARDDVVDVMEYNSSTSSTNYHNFTKSRRFSGEDVIVDPFQDIRRNKINRQSVKSIRYVEKRFNTIDHPGHHTTKKDLITLTTLGTTQQQKI